MPQNENKPWKVAAIEVLKATAKAMHYADIADEIKKRGLRSKVGATPAASVNVVLHDSIKKEGDASPFVKVGPGEFMLKASLTAPPKPGALSPGSAGEKSPPTVKPDDAAADEAAETGGDY